jgi:hypothetical protein
MSISLRAMTLPPVFSHLRIVALSLLDVKKSGAGCPATAHFSA